MHFTSYNSGMSFTWTPHRFSGGALALDLANTVVLRDDAARRVDRFADPAAIVGFAEAANLWCVERERFGTILTHGNLPDVMTLREAADRYFRARTKGESGDGTALAGLLAAMATVEAAAVPENDLGRAAVRSLLGLLALPDPRRLKACGHCGWLFLDRSKNRSRFWCDMAVCGNRTKASRHYRRKIMEAPA